jgi:hypothetical protein
VQRFAAHDGRFVAQEAAGLHPLDRDISVSETGQDFGGHVSDQDLGGDGRVAQVTPGVDFMNQFRPKTFRVKF